MEVAPGIYSLGDRQGGRVCAHLLDDGQGITVGDSLVPANAHPILNELPASAALLDIKHFIQTIAVWHSSTS